MLEKGWQRERDAVARRPTQGTLWPAAAVPRAEARTNSALVCLPLLGGKQRASRAGARALSGRARVVRAPGGGWSVRGAAARTGSGLGSSLGGSEASLAIALSARTRGRALRCAGAFKTDNAPRVSLRGLACRAGESVTFRD